MSKRKTIGAPPRAKTKPEVTFESIGIHQNTLKYLNESNITQLNALQNKILPHLIVCYIRVLFIQ